MREQQPTARFYVYHRGNWVKLSLREGERVETFESDRCEEGFTSQANRYHYAHGIVSRETYHDGQDCDGRHSTTTATFCAVGDLQSHTVMTDGDGLHRRPDPSFPPLPTWEPDEDRPTRCYDQFAEAANY